MGLFNKILEKLGLGGSTTKAAEPSQQPVKTAQTAPLPQTPHVAEKQVLPLPSIPITEVDVMAQLTDLAAKNPEKLNWKVSIVDLLKLLGLESSYAVRKELAAELNCPAEKMADSAQMNMWLHKTVLQKLAANGGNIPKDMLD